MATTTPTSGETQLIGDFFNELETRNADSVKLWNYPLALADTTASSLLWVGSMGTLDVESFAPKNFESYHRSRTMYDAVSGVASIWGVAGQAAKGARMGSKMSEMAHNAGVSPRIMEAVFSDVQSVSKMDSMMALARTSKAQSVAAHTGMTTPNLTLSGTLADGADAIKSLSGKGTYEDAAAWANSISTRNSVKESIAQELAIFATMNQNEFFFPEDASAWSYLTFGGLGVGLGVGIDTAMRRAAIRKNYSSAAALGGDTARRAQEASGLFTQRSAAKGVVGEDWQQLMAGTYGMERLQRLETAADDIARNSGGTLSRSQITEEVQKMRLALDTGMRETAGSMFSKRLPEPQMRKGVGSQPAISTAMQGGPNNARIAQHVKDNPTLGVALADLGTTDIGYAYSANRMYLEDKIKGAHRKLDRAKTSDQQRLAQGELDEFNSSYATIGAYRPAVIENTSTANMNPNRRTPYWETAAASGKVNYQKGQAGYSGSPLRITASGELATQTGLKLDAVKAADMNFADATQMQKLTADVTGSKRWASEFWADALGKSPAALRDLPFPVLDALASGKLQLPNGTLSPAAPLVRAMVDSGEFKMHSMAQKLEWYVKNHSRTELGEEALDLFDAEKALNVRLTDETGMPNLLGHAFEAFRKIPNANAKSFSTSFKNINQLNDDLFQMGVGHAGIDGSLVSQKMQDDFIDGFRGIGLEKTEGYQPAIGALYHKVDVPTDGEKQVARLAAMRNAMHDEYLMNSSSPFVRDVVGAAMQDSIAFAKAGDTSSLFHDTFVKGNLVSTKTFAHRFQAAIQHAHTVKKSVKSAMELHADANLKPIADNVKSLIKSNTWGEVAPQLSAAHQLISRGFSLTDDVYKKGANALDISRPGARNTLEQLGALKGAPDDLADWKLFDISVAANEGRYVVLELSDEAADVLNSYARVSSDQYEAINSLRRASGAPAMERLNGHLPVMNFNRYQMRYIQDVSTGRVVGYVKAKTDAEARKELTRTLESGNKARAAKGQPALMEATTQEIKAHYDAIDEMFMHNLRDFSGIKQQGAAKGKNADFRLDVSTDLAQDMMIAMRNTYEDLGRRTTASLFSRPLSEAQQMQKRIGQISDGKDKTYFTAVEQWQNVLLGRNDLPEGSLAGRFHTWAEDAANTAVGKLADATPTFWRAIGKELHGQATPAQAALAKQVMANHKPFDKLAANAEIADYLKVGEAVDPFRIAKALQLANRGTTAAFLKIANVAMPVLNYTGAAVTMPAVVQSVQPMAKETAEAWATRVGPVADYLDMETMTATVSAHKLMTEGFELSLRDTAAIEFAAKRGYIEANMLEELNKANDIRPSKFVEAMEGVGYYSDFINTWLVNPAMRKVTGKEPSAHTLTERSESGTRAWTHMTGYALAKRNGRDLTEEQMHSFAHWFSNQNIADFSPDIRGDAFNGVAGIPFGLFQSYAINLYQRLFRYVEDGNKRALAVQAATQAGMFGVEGLPGWDALNATYFNQPRDVKANNQGATTLNERIYSAMGKDTADLLMGGTLSNLPRLAGAEGAINLYSSGDMNPRALGLPPSISFAQQTAQGFNEAFKRSREEIPKLFTAEDFDGGRIAQVFANYAPSRGHRSLVELALGESVDRRGNLVEDDTRSGLSLLARVLGTRTRDELMTSEAMWSNSQAQRQRVTDMGRVRDQMLRQIRNGEVSEEEMSYFLADYLTAGGDQDQWARWLDFTTEKATMTKDERALAKVAKRTGEILPHNFAAVSRLAAAGVEPTPEQLGQAPVLN